MPFYITQNNITREISREEYYKMLEPCKQGKHKLRQNNFGVVWCIRCGLLSNTHNAPKMGEEDKINLFYKD